VEMKVNRTALFSCQKEVAVCCCYVLFVWSQFSGCSPVYSMHTVSETAISRCSSGPVMY